MKRTIIVVLLLIILISIFIIYKYNNTINNLNDKFDDLDSKFNQLKQNYTQLSLEKRNVDNEFLNLTKDYEDLSLRYTEKVRDNLEKEVEINNLIGNYNDISENYDLLNQEVGVFKTRIEESMDWFRSNSTIDNLKEERRIKSNLRKCLDCKEDLCNIKTACIFIVNKEDLGLKYEIDQVTSGKEDKLQSLDNFITNKKGDCEDFSLLFKAQVNYLIDYVKSQDKTPVIEGIIQSDTTKNYFITDKWYFPGGYEKKELSKEYIYPYVACGNIFDPNIDEVGGHCLILFSNKEIENSLDIEDLESVVLIEPQTGMYVGIANNNGIFETNNQENQVSQIITDIDYYMHSSVLYRTREYTLDHWYSYGYYLNKINELE